MAMTAKYIKERVDQLYDSKTEQSDEAFRVAVINILYMLCDNAAVTEEKLQEQTRQINNMPADVRSSIRKRGI